MNNASVSIIIINWNHGEYLKECLDSIRNQSYPEYSITILDNGSTDGSPDWIKKLYSEVNLYLMTSNLGFSQAFNQGVRSTDDPFILSLNPDIIVRPSFISELFEAISQDEQIGIAAPKLLREEDPSFLDSTGLFINRQRRVYDRGQGELDQGQYDNLCEVFGACGAAALYRRVMLENVAIDGEYFDEDFFAYYEDADLSWRAQLKGWRAIYVPKAVAQHVRGWGDTLRKQREKNVSGPRLALRNRYLMTIKNDSTTGFIVDFPQILIAEIPRLVYMGIKIPQALLGLWDLIRLLPSAWRKRKHIKKNRTINSNIIRHKFFNQTTKTHNENQSTEGFVNLL